MWVHPNLTRSISTPKDETIHQRLYRKGKTHHPFFLLHILSTQLHIPERNQATDLILEITHGSNFS